MPQAISISPNQVRYIKLGEKGIWEEDCVRNGIIRLGFWTGTRSRFKICSAGNWEALRRDFLKEEECDLARARIFTNQVRHFFDDDGSTLWITFHTDHMYWGFLGADPPQIVDGSSWRTVVDGWRCEDLNGRELTKKRVGSALAKYAQFPRTSCDLKKVATYAIGVVNGKTTRTK